MKSYLNQEFVGERALFMISDAYIEDCTFLDGESPLKECKEIDVVHSSFQYKYPLWYGESIKVIETEFLPLARAGIWYSKGVSLQHCDLKAPKLFRYCKGVSLLDVEFSEGKETLWWCDGVVLKDAVVAQGDYLLMQSKNIEIDHLDLQGNYAFDGCENIHVQNSVLRTKDAFWNCKNVEVENCYIVGEYIGWNSENVVLRHCEIHSHQGFCYMKNVKLIDCKLVDTDLAFEYCENIDATIYSSIDSVKNPISGRIECGPIGELIFDDPKIDPSKTEIIQHE